VSNSLLWTEKRTKLRDELLGDSGAKFLRVRLFEIALGDDERSSLRAIELLLELGLGAGEDRPGEDLSPDERRDAYRILGGLLRVSAPQIQSLVASWSRGDFAVGRPDPERNGPDLFSALRPVGDAGLFVEPPQSGAGAGAAGSERGSDPPADRDDAAAARED